MDFQIANQIDGLSDCNYLFLAPLAFDAKKNATDHCVCSTFALRSQISQSLLNDKSEVNLTDFKCSNLLDFLVYKLKLGTSKL